MLGNVYENRVLTRGEADRPAAIFVCDTCKFTQGFMTDSAHAHAHTDGIEAGLLLPPHTKMVIVAVGTCIFSCRRGLPSEAPNQFPAKAIQTPFLQKKRKAALRPWSASALIVKNFDDLNDDVVGLIRLDEPVKIRGNRKPARSHLPAH